MPSPDAEVFDIGRGLNRRLGFGHAHRASVDASPADARPLVRNSPLNGARAFSERNQE